MGAPNFLWSFGLFTLRFPYSYRGGKTASALALEPDLPPNTLSSLIIVDVTPAKVSLSREFVHYANAMKSIDDAGVKDTKAAYKILEEYPDIKIVSTEKSRFAFETLEANHIASLPPIPLFLGTTYTTVSSHESWRYRWCSKV